MTCIPEDYVKHKESGLYNCPHCGVLLKEEEAKTCAAAHRGEKVSPEPDDELKAAAIPCPYYD